MSSPAAAAAPSQQTMLTSQVALLPAGSIIPDYPGDLAYLESIVNETAKPPVAHHRDVTEFQLVVGTTPGDGALDLQGTVNVLDDDAAFPVAGYCLDGDFVLDLRYIPEALAKAQHFYQQHGWCIIRLDDEECKKAFNQGIGCTRRKFEGVKSDRTTTYDIYLFFRKDSTKDPIPAIFKSINMLPQAIRDFRLLVETTPAAGLCCWPAYTPRMCIGGYTRTTKMITVAKHEQEKLTKAFRMHNRAKLNVVAG